MRPLLLFLVLTALVSGCVGSSKPAAVIESTGPSLGFGMLRGTVYDGEQLPLAGVRIEIRGPADERDLASAADGSYLAEDLLEGSYVVTFATDRHEGVRSVVTVHADEETSHDVVLGLLPEYRPYFRILPALKGYYDCGLEAIILTGDCMILYETGTMQEDPLTKEQQMLRFNIGPGWEKIVAELTWTQGANNQLDGMHLYLAPGNESGGVEDHHTKIVVAEGPDQPLRIDLAAGTIHPTAERYPGSDVRAVIPAEGGPVLGLVYPRGRLAESVGTVCQPNEPDKCFLGVGVGAGIQFTLYVAAFFNGEPVPPNFTMVPA